MSVRAKQRVEAKVSTTDGQKFDEELADFDSVTPTWDQEADFEEGDTSDFDVETPAWDKEVDVQADFDVQVDADGDMNDTAAAKHDGATGLEFTFDDANPARGHLNLGAIDQVSGCISFWLDPNTVEIDDGAFVTIFGGYDGGAQGVFGLTLGNNAGTPELQPYYFDDAPAFQSLGWTDTVNEYQKITIFWAASTGPGNDDGYMYIYVNDVLFDSATGLDTDTRDWDVGYFGMITTNSAGFGGSFYMDTIKIDPVGAPHADKLAAKNGTYGMSIPILTSLPKYGEFTDPAAETTVTAEFWLDPNTIIMGHGETFYILWAGDFYARLYALAGPQIYYIQGFAVTDTGLENTGYNLISDASHHIRIVWAASTGPGNDDGYLHLYIDDVLVDATLTGLDNDTKTINSIIFGSRSGVDAGTYGIIYMDDCKWDPVGAPSISQLAAKNGTYGMSILVTEATNRQATFTDPTAEVVVTAECWLDPNALVMANNDEFTLIQGGVGAEFYTQLKYTSGAYKIYAGVVLDAGGDTTADYSITDEPHHIRLVWAASTGAGNDDGYLRLFIDDVLQEALTGLDNDTKDIGTIYYGAVTGIDAGTYGIFYLDDCKWGPWADLTPDVVGDIKGFWGMVDNGPLDLLADTGWMSLILDNTSGLYTPGASGGIPSWGKGMPVRLIFTYSDLQYVRFYGKIENLDIQSGTFGGERVFVEVLDWLDYAATHPMLSPGIGTDQRGDEMATTIVADMPIAPLATDYDTGINTFPTAFDIITTKTKAYSELSKIAFSEIAPIYLTKDPVYGETLVFENAEARNGLRTPDFVADNIMTRLETEYGENVINRFANLIYPRYIDVAPQVLFELQTRQLIESGATIGFRGNYSDPSGGAEVSGRNMLAPVINVDYTMNTQEDGLGANISADLVVGVVYGTEGATYTLTNNNALAGWVWIRAQGDGIYTYNPIEHAAMDTTSRDLYGYKSLTLHQKYKQNLTRGALAGAVILEQEKNPRKKINRVQFIANRSDALMMAFLTRDVGDMCHLTEDKSEVDEYAYIQGVGFTITVGGLVKYNWIIKGMLSLLLGLSLLSIEGDTGSQDAINYGFLPSVFSDDTGDYVSVSAWIYMTDLPGADSYQIVTFSTNAGGFRIYVRSGANNDKIGIYSNLFDNQPGVWTSTNACVGVDAWYNVIMTFDMSNVVNVPILYVGGVVVPQTEIQPDLGAAYSRNGTPLVIGNRKTATEDYDKAFDGLIKDVRVYNVILTQAEATSLAADGNVTRGMKFQGPCVRTGDLEYFEDRTLTSVDKLIDNMFGMVGTPNDDVITRLIP